MSELAQWRAYCAVEDTIVGYVRALSVLRITAPMTSMSTDIDQQDG